MSATLSPGHQRFLAAVRDALKRGDGEGAMNFADQAVELGIEDANLFLLAGERRLRMGDGPRAHDLLSRALLFMPDNVEAIALQGISLSMMGRPRDALAAFDRALALKPEALLPAIHRAQALESLGRLREAEAALEGVVAAAPEDTRALEHLANLCVRRGDMVRARGYAARALKIAPQLAAPAIALASAELADRNFEAARALAEPLAANKAIGPMDQSIAAGLLGDALDGLGKPQEAFAAYTAAREILRVPMQAMLRGKESAIALVRRQAEYFRDAPAGQWRNASAPEAPVKTHAFLVGFPRSGTTLLEQALASHPGIRTMEEVDCLGDVAGEFFYAPDGMVRFAGLGEGALDELRARYWRGVAEQGLILDRPVFVDKMPLNSVHLGAVARLFPAAKILFALRDPRDVVFSCFRRRLVMSAHMAELSTLEGAAGLYDAVMGLVEVYRAKLALPILDLRHEDMVADFDGQTRRACDFLDVAWSGAMRRFASDAKERDVKTPSAQQIVRGLNKDGAGQWRRFAHELAPAHAVLEPWVQRFGYTD